MSQNHITIRSYADEMGEHPSTTYRHLGEEKLNYRRRRKDGSYTYPREYLDRCRRKSVAKGAKSLQSLFNMEMRSLDFAGFSGYSVTANGKVIDRLKNSAVRTTIDNNGYRVAKLDRLNERQRVHRLVLIGFDGLPRNSSTQADHLNGDKLDNRFDNLQWVSAKENNRRQMKRLFPHPNAPKNYNERELETIRAGIIDGLTFSEFIASNAEMMGRISRSTFDRRKKDLLKNTKIPNWDDIIPARRFVLALGCALYRDPDHVAESTKHFYRWDDGKPSLGEIVLFRRWLIETGWLDAFRSTRELNINGLDESELSGGQGSVPIDEFRWNQFHKQIRRSVRQYWHRDAFDKFTEIDPKQKLRIMLTKGENPYADLEDGLVDEARFEEREIAISAG